MYDFRDFLPADPMPARVMRPPYTSYWLGPFGALAAWGLSSLGLAWWIWRKAPLIDDRPEF